MTFAEFQSQWNMLEFETTLKYVSIGNIKFKPDKGVDRVVRSHRDDATQILRWLQKDRRVERILHVIIDDMEPTYHSNESIGKALETAGVEILEWRRPDLCPSTIFEIGENLRELHLQWGGNNAILRAWSESRGLPRLAQNGKLKLIAIVWPEDSPDLCSNISKHKKSFDARLRRNWISAAKQSSKGSKIQSPSVRTSADKAQAGESPQHRNEQESQDKTELPDPKQISQQNPQDSQVLTKEERVPKSVPVPEIQHISARSSARPKLGDNSSQADKMDQHFWMQCMEDFTTAFLRVKQPSSLDIADKKSLAPVQIALIDDGVDITSSSLQGKQYYGRSFAFDEASGRNFSYWMSDSNHGTIMARFIRKLCPTADIYVIKVATRRATRNPNKLTIDEKSAVDAINHAVNRKAKIISMSWSVKAPVNRELRAMFDTAVQRAVQNNTIMLCASSDQGRTGDDETYPYDANRANIIRIGAATALGDNADYVNKHQVDFLFPGHDILLKSSTLDKELGDVHKGSSVATAVAAGLAAMVLECIRIGHYWTSRHNKNLSMAPITEEDLAMDSKAIKAVFEGMSKSRSRYIWVWETFTPSICERVTDGGQDVKRVTITNLANRFLRKDL